MSDFANIFKIDRLHIETDGRGVRSLVCFRRCPLGCKYCPNVQEMRGAFMSITPEELLDRLMIDDVYFNASSGGVTFGGGEPSLYGKYIEEFRKLCPPDWTLFIETSLNVPLEQIEILSKVIDHWYIDIKDLTPEIYRKYTGASNSQVLNNLLYLIEEGLADKITVRVPLIPGFNNLQDVVKSESELRELGVVSIQRFTYNIDNPITRPLMGKPAPKLKRL